MAIKLRKTRFFTRFNSHGPVTKTHWHIKSCMDGMGKRSAFLWSYKKVFPSQKDEKEKKTKRIFN